MGELTELFSRRNKKRFEYPLFSVTNSRGFVNQQEQFEDREMKGEDIAAYKIVSPGEFAYNPARINVGSIARYDGESDCMISSLYVCFRVKKELVDSQLFLHILKSPKMVYNYGINGEGGVRIYLFYPNFARIRVKLPFVAEQCKIATFLDLVEERIRIQNKIIEKYQSLIRAIIQRAQHESSEIVYLRDVLTERKELNRTRFEVCSVSVSKGIINQVDYLGRSFASKETSHYRVVREGDVVYTKSPTGDFPFGIIKQSRLSYPVAVSPLYGVYTPLSYDIGSYLHYYFCIPQNTLNYLRKLVQKGAKNTINITNTHFLDNMVKIPDNYNLHRIITVVKELSLRIENEESFLNLLERQRDYLLRQLFV